MRFAGENSGNSIDFGNREIPGSNDNSRLDKVFEQENLSSSIFFIKMPTRKAGPKDDSIDGLLLSPVVICSGFRMDRGMLNLYSDVKESAIIESFSSGFVHAFCNQF